jgi:hypothetical protein
VLYLEGKKRFQVTVACLSVTDHYFIDSRGRLEEVLVDFGVSGGRQIFACRFDLRNDVLIRWAGPLD